MRENKKFKLVCLKKNCQFYKETVNKLSGLYDQRIFCVALVSSFYFIYLSKRILITKMSLLNRKRKPR